MTDSLDPRDLADTSPAPKETLAMSDHQQHGGEIPEGHVLTGNEAVSRFVDMWLAGYMSGVGSALMNARNLADERQGTDRPERIRDDQVEQMARAMVEAAAQDPLFVEEIRREVTHILVCHASGPERWRTQQ